MTVFGFSEELVRPTVFVAVFLLMAFAETAWPRKALTQDRWRRWMTNWSLVLLNTFALRVFVPVLAIGMAANLEAKGWELFGLIELPVWLEIISAIVLLDLMIYVQHFASHKVPLLWRVHKVHHADRDIDVTTGSRFHALEIVLSMIYKLACVSILGPSAVAVFLFELILSTSAMFNHSIIHQETDSNYGFFLSTWDRLFNTFIEQPEKGHDGMTIGLEGFQIEGPSHLGWSLLLALEGEIHQREPIYPVNKF